MPNFVEIPEVRSSRIIPFEDAEDEDRKITVSREEGIERGSEEDSFVRVLTAN